MNGLDELTREERQLRLALRIFAGLSALFVAGYIAGGLFDDEEFRFVVNSATKDALFVAIAIAAAANLRRYGWLTLLVIAGHAILILAQIVMLLVGGQPDVEMFGAEIAATTFMLVWIALDLLVIAVFAVLYHRAQSARYRLDYLSPYEFVTLRALAEVLIEGDEEPVGPDAIARKVEGYLAGLEARGKGRIRLAFIGLTLFPLLTLHPPFAAMSPGDRLAYVKRRFHADVSTRRTIHWLRPYVQAMIRAAQQMVYLGYYGDPRTYRSTGYVPHAERPGRRLADGAEGGVTTPLRSLSPAEAPDGTSDPDVVIVGSGAAGAILAYRLAERGRRVLVLERGKHIPPSEFTEDEVDMYLKLYNDGALQLSRDFRFQVLQGMCVGGSTVVNNAICFEAPQPVLREWNDKLRARLDLDELDECFDAVRGWLRVGRPPPDAFAAQAEAFERGVRTLGLPGELGVVKTNMERCLGCGHCNIGCRYGRKLSMLDTVLPWAQRDFGEDAVRILPEFRVTGIERSDGRAEAVHGELPGGEPLRVRAKTIVLSAGAVNSSWLLGASGLGGPRAGAEVYFNMASPMTADFGRRMDSFAGLQMSHFYAPPHGEFVLESWFNPVATQALVMPGWFEEHYANMRRYSEMAAGGVLVGTRGPATVRARRDGPDIDYVPGGRDLERMLDGLRLLGRIYLAAGAKSVMPSTYRYYRCRSDEELDAFARQVADGSDLLLNSAHPQGGNPLSADPEVGVVDESFAVRGIDDLYVCDASVFPSSVTVNPQLTVMALAQYAAGRINGDARA
jgi:choline dehydrogenase-like flavoprotein